MKAEVTWSIDEGFRKELKSIGYSEKAIQKISNTNKKEVKRRWLIFEEDDEEYRKRLEELGFNDDIIDYYVRHEKQHYDEAKRLGYKPTYSAIVAEEFIDGGIGLGIECLVFMKKPTKQEAIKIIRAVENPGARDLEMLESLLKEVGEEKK